MQRFFKSIFLFFLVSIAFSLFIALTLAQNISLSLNQPQNYLLDTLLSVGKNNPYLGKDRVNFIVLGLDKRNDSLEKTEVTDTIMLVSLNIKNQKINTISIPRDLWFYEINSKVNEIYPLSLKETNQLYFIKDKFQNLTGQPIDHVIVLTTENLIKFVNLIGGVDVVLENGFIDKLYPNPEYIKNPNSTVSKYKIVEFKSGLNHLDSENITEFVRSRKGGDTVNSGGTDLARIQRQQLLLEAILNKVKTGQFISNKLDITGLYQFWNKEVVKDISDTNILNLLFMFGENITNLSLNKINLPVGTNSKNGVLYHPNSFINKQWVFVPSDKEYKLFRQFFSESM